ncbi:MAG TPA: hypothetical protein VKV77_08245 [Methylovirgula sp.]|nr:hypothetical protein [Methylovirgula sp.]
MALADISARGISNTDFIPESVAGLAVVVLTILGLAGVAPDFLAAIATIIFGVGLLLYGAAAVAEVGRMFSGYSEGQTVVELAASGLSTIFLAGAAGIVLGILALIGKVPVSLVAISAIGYGGALIISSNFTRRLRMLTVASSEETVLTRFVQESASESAGLQVIAGLASIVLGILVLAGIAPVVLVLAALLELGCFAILSSASVASSLVQTFVGRPPTQRRFSE